MKGLRLSAIQSDDLWWTARLGAIRNPAWQHWQTVPLLSGWAWVL